MRGGTQYGHRDERYWPVQLSASRVRRVVRDVKITRRFRRRCRVEWQVLTIHPRVFRVQRVNNNAFAFAQTSDFNIPLLVVHYSSRKPLVGARRIFLRHFRYTIYTRSEIDDSQRCRDNRFSYRSRIGTFSRFVRVSNKIYTRTHIYFTCVDKFC